MYCVYCVLAFHHLIYSICVDRGIEAGIQVVQKIDYLERGRVCRDGREANDVREIDCYFTEFFGINGHAQLQFLSNRAKRSLRV